MYTLELMIDIDAIKRRFESLLPTVDERMRRLIAAAESLAIDYGGISIVSRATGVSRRAIARGIVELGNPPMPSGGAIRKPGGGRKSTVEQDATLVRDLELLIEPLSRGDPESPLRWTCKSVRKLAQALGRHDHRVSHRLVAELLHELGYSLQANAKTLEGSSHPDRNAQFEHIHRKVRRFLRQGQPVIWEDIATARNKQALEYLGRGENLVAITMDVTDELRVKAGHLGSWRVGVGIELGPNL